MSTKASRSVIPALLTWMSSRAPALDGGRNVQKLLGRERRAVVGLRRGGGSVARVECAAQRRASRTRRGEDAIVERGGAFDETRSAFAAVSARATPPSRVDQARRRRRGAGVARSDESVHRSTSVEARAP